MENQRDGLRTAPLPVASRRGVLAALGAAGLVGFASTERASADVLSGENNRAPENTQVVAGGKNNRATGDFAAILGGQGNRARGRGATVGGGGDAGSGDVPDSVGGGTRTNGNLTLDDFSTVSGGRRNQAGSPGNDPESAPFSTVAGGERNTANHFGATVGGGTRNTASGSSATIGGGNTNTATDIGATVGGGRFNDAEDLGATVAGGEANEANSQTATVGGGFDNTADAQGTTVGGGRKNTASELRATVGGGESNTASGAWATVPGGLFNVAGGDLSFAVGLGAKTEAPDGTPHRGAVVFADATNAEFRSQGPNEFRSQMPMYAPSFNTTSARAKKRAVDPVDPGEVLDAVTDLEVGTWEFTDTDDGRHMGPMAEAFHDAFGLGDDDETIASVDADGVSLAAIQGLASRLEEKDDRIDELEDRLVALEGEIDG